MLLGWRPTKICEQPLPLELLGNVSECNQNEVYLSGANLRDEALFRWLVGLLGQHGRANRDVIILLFLTCHFPANGGEVLAREVLPRYSNLTIVKLVGSNLRDAGVAAVAEGLGQYCPKLKWAVFNENLITDVGFLALCRHLPCAKLRMLAVAWNQIDSIPHDFRRFHNLNKFDAIPNPWGCGWKSVGDVEDGSEADMRSALLWARQEFPVDLTNVVRQCDFNGVQIADADLRDEALLGRVLEVLGQNFRVNFNVSNLSVVRCRMPVNGGELIAKDVLPHCPSLAVIDFTETRLGDAGIVAVMESLGRYCPKLHTAYLDDCDMTDVGYLALCRHLPCASLRYLSVACNQIGIIPAEFRRFDQLQHLSAHGNPWWKCGWQCQETVCGDGRDTDAASALAWARQRPEAEEDDLMVKPAV